MEAQRTRPGQQLVDGRTARPRHHARHPVGHSGPGRRGPRSRCRRERQGAVRLVRRAHRLCIGDARVGRAKGRAGRVGAVLERRVDQARPLHRQGQHRLSLPDLPRHAAAARRVEDAGSGARQRVSQPRRPQVLDEPRLGAVAPRRARTHRRRPTALRPGHDAPRNQRRRLQPRRLPSPRQRRTSRCAGQLRP